MDTTDTLTEWVGELRHLRTTPGCPEYLWILWQKYTSIKFHVFTTKDTTSNFSYLLDYRSLHTYLWFSERSHSSAL